MKTTCQKITEQVIVYCRQNLARLHSLAADGVPMFCIRLYENPGAATDLVYLSREAAAADIARLEAYDMEDRIYEPNSYSLFDASPFFL